MKRLLVVFTLICLSVDVYSLSFREITIKLEQRPPAGGAPAGHFSKSGQLDVRTYEQIAASRRIFEQAKPALRKANVDWDYEEFRRRVRISYGDGRTMATRVLWCSQKKADAISEAMWAAIYEYLSQEVGQRSA
jgi:hypothetical protein